MDAIVQRQIETLVSYQQMRTIMYTLDERGPERIRETKVEEDKIARQAAERMAADLIKKAADEAAEVHKQAAEIAAWNKAEEEKDAADKKASEEIAAAIKLMLKKVLLLKERLKRLRRKQKRMHIGNMRRASSLHYSLIGSKQLKKTGTELRIYKVNKEPRPSLRKILQ